MVEYNHPEMRKDEVCLGNVTEGFYSMMQYASKRLGMCSRYSDNGMPLFPVFVDRVEFTRHFSGFRNVIHAASH